MSRQSRNILRGFPPFDQRYSIENLGNPRKWPPCCLEDSASHKLYENMARKRAQSTKEQKGSRKKTSPVSRGGVKSKSDAICTKNSRSSTARARSVKQDVKSTDASLKRTPVNQDDSNDMAKEKGRYSLDKNRCKLTPKLHCWFLWSHLLVSLWLTDKL